MGGGQPAGRGSATPDTGAAAAAPGRAAGEVPARKVDPVHHNATRCLHPDALRPPEHRRDAGHFEQRKRRTDRAGACGDCWRHPRRVPAGGQPAAGVELAERRAVAAALQDRGGVGRGEGGNLSGPGGRPALQRQHGGPGSDGGGGRSGPGPFSEGDARHPAIYHGGGRVALQARPGICGGELPEPGRNQALLQVRGSHRSAPPPLSPRAAGSG